MKMEAIHRKISELFIRIVLSVLSVGPIPNHVSFVMDGNRRFAVKKKLDQGSGHRAGASALMNILKSCYSLGVKYVSVYAFSIDNFRRKPEEVEMLMDLFMEKMVSEETFLNKNGIRVHVIGDLNLLNEPVRIAAQKLMKNTAMNTKLVVMICVAYTSTNEIVHGVRESVERQEKTEEKGGMIRVADIEKHMYMAVAPDPDLMIRTSGKMRLSNFLLWQTGNCQLYSPVKLWPEIRAWDLMWGVVGYQRSYAYLEKKKKKKA